MIGLEGLRAIGKILKLESFQLERSFQLTDLPCKNKNLETTLLLKTFQLNDLPTTFMPNDGINGFFQFSQKKENIIFDFILQFFHFFYNRARECCLTLNENES